MTLRLDLTSQKISIGPHFAPKIHSFFNTRAIALPIYNSIVITPCRRRVDAPWKRWCDLPNGDVEKNDHLVSYYILTIELIVSVMINFDASTPTSMSFTIQMQGGLGEGAFC
jgi:hypothetical protein